VAIDLFEVKKITRQALAKSLTKLLDKYGLRKKIVAYVKDEGSNLNVMIVTLKCVLSYESLGLKESFQGIFFGHAFSKACQYGIAKEKVYIGLKYVFINFAQVDLQKCIIWPKKSKKWQIGMEQGLC
jgi:hypothetical protein